MTDMPQAREMAEHADSGRFLQAILLFSVAGLFAAAYLDTFRELWHYWIEGYNWQFVVPIAFVYMLWDRNDLYAGLHRRPSIVPGAALLLIGISLLVVGQLSSTHSLREISIIVSIFGLVFLLFGAGYVRNLFWPLIYLVLMTSLTSDLLEYLRYPLKLVSATISADTLQMAGYAVYRDGTFLQLPHITLEVADSCSGLNQIVSSIALGIPIAFTILDQWWKRIFIITLSVVLGLVMNWVRVFLISIWHYDSAKEVVHGPYGIYELPFIFLVGVFITLAVAMAISDRTATRTVKRGSAISGDAAGQPDDRRLTRAAVVAILLLSATAVYLNTWEAKAVPLQEGFTGFPRTIAGYEGTRLEKLDKPFHTGLAHDELIIGYTGSAGRSARVYTGYFHSQNQQEELVDYRYNWLHDGAELIDLAPEMPGYSMKRSRIEAGDRPVTVFFSYHINGRNVVDTRLAKLASLVDALLHRRSNGAIIMVIFDGDATDLTGNERAFLVQAVQAISARLPGGR